MEGNWAVMNKLQLPATIPTSVLRFLGINLYFPENGNIFLMEDGRGREDHFLLHSDFFERGLVGWREVTTVQFWDFSSVLCKFPLVCYFHSSFLPVRELFLSAPEDESGFSFVITS